ncbi:hypothetical protein BASA81_014424 [Batrachochytrium salamandrivorans]|nr:hypothetical protein BASA81_014424 [Batrachochytrium salamandrivorans]
MDDVPEVILERCKRELKHFRFRDNSFLRILEDGKSTAAYVTTDKRVDVMKALSHLVGSLECPQLLYSLSDGGSTSMAHGRNQVREQVSDYLHRLCNSLGLGKASQGDD